MKIFDIKKLEDCFDGSMIYQYTFFEAITKKIMNNLAQGEQLQYYPEFLKPFFKIITKNDLQIKGILGDDNIEVIFPQRGKNQKKESFEKHLHQL